ncbi:MAG: AsnC family transcriptional regulator [Promethearchaeota archaeon]
MDSIEQKIVDLLAINCRISPQDLSKRIGISANDAKRRYDTLIETDVIHEFKTLLSPLITNEELFIAVLDFNVVPSEKDINKALSSNPSVWKVHRALEDNFVVFGFYFSQEELSKLAFTLRSLPGVGYVELHSNFSRHWGGKIALNDNDKMILRCLMENTRMSVADIAKKTGLASTMIYDSIEMMRKSETVLFTINAADYMKQSKIEVLTKIQWNVRDTSQEKVSEWLKESFSSVYLREFVSVTEPTIFFNFIVNHVQDVELVRSKAINSGLISRIAPLILFPGTVFPDPRVKKLDEFLTETGFHLENNLLS